MNTVWKLTLKPGVHRLPAGAAFIDAQDGDFWAPVDDQMPAKDYTVHVVLDGGMLPSGVDEDCYLATVNGQHVFITE